MSESKFIFSEENFQRIIENAPVGIVIIDKELKWHLVNQRFCEITGFSWEELQQKTFLDITYKEDINRNLNLYNKLLDGTVNEYFYEKRYLRKDGKIIWVRLAVAAVRIHGEYSHMVVSVEDIDDNKKYQQALESTNKELDLLLYQASHNLKAPISTLLGITNILRLENPSLAGSDTFNHLVSTVEKFRNQNESMIQLMQVNEQKVNITEVNLERVVKNLAGSSLNPEAICYTALRGTVIRSDPFFLSIIIKKLMENSLIFSGAAPCSVIISYAMADGKNKLYFKDNGPGIPEAIKDKIFDLFYKGTEKSPGSGLGLYLVRKSIEKLNGNISVDSAEGRGTKFTISLPVN